MLPADYEQISSVVGGPAALDRVARVRAATSVRVTWKRWSPLGLTGRRATRVCELDHPALRPNPEHGTSLARLGPSLP